MFVLAPFKAPLDPDQITVTWKNATDEHGNKFANGETYELRYPEVKMPKTAVYVYNQGYRDPDGLLESKVQISNLRYKICHHICCIVAFLFVLFTYFGVSYLLGGLHSYA